MKKIWLFSSLLGSLTLAGVIIASTQASSYVPEPTPFIVAPNIVAIGATVGLSAAQLSEVHAQLGTCTQAKAAACYQDDIQTMFIRPETMSDPHLPTVLAHEYLHFVWFRKLNVEGRKITGDSLMVLYDRQDELGRELRWRLQPYIEAHLVPGTDSFNSELHSVWCTEVADNRMIPSSQQYCAKWIPLRNALQNSIF